MSSYAGRHAQLYDLFYADKRYPEEAAFVRRCLEQFAVSPAQEILELACGTGSHAFELEKFGYDITATDNSPDMLRVAAERAKKTGSKVSFAQADMRALPFPDATYDAAICLFDSIGYLRTNENLARAFGEIRRCLRSSGVFIFEFWHAAAMLSQYSPQRLRRWQTPNGEVIRISETTLDRGTALASVDYTIHELKNDGTDSTIRETQINRYFAVEEMRTLVSAANFEGVKFFAGFSETESIDADTWHVVAVVRKSAVTG
jgi:ubiquinone/menaquinone biosynthesis C-methylase UbiE